MEKRIKNQHLLWRAGFGPAYHDNYDLDKMDPVALWNVLKKSSVEPPSKLGSAQNLVRALLPANATPEDWTAFQSANKVQVREATMQMRQLTRDQIKDLTLDWINQFVHSKQQLREKMSLFWHGFFPCRYDNGFYQQELLHIMRNHALGNFGELLRAVSKSPSMLTYLNNIQNRKRKPNENFARELMELFTLGRGHYTEQDIKESARAFTGWNFDGFNGFVFQTVQHDDGVKTFLGRKGRFDGDDIIDILLEQKQTAYYVTEKIYSYFVNPVIDKKVVQKLADEFYQSGYQILTLMENIFTADWFYNKENIGVRIKSPIELIAGVQRAVDVKPVNPLSIIFFQKLMGQWLFNPPNVAGWPGHKAWIDSNSLMVRMIFPRIWASREVLKMVLKADDDVEMGKPSKEAIAQRNAQNYFRRTGNAEWDWKPLYEKYKSVPRESLYETIARHILQSHKIPSVKVMEKYIDQTSRETYISTAVIQLMSTPEYQVC